MTLYLGYALLGFLCGYALRRPACQREHLPRHLDPAIVDREGDEGLPPPDVRTWTGAPSITDPITSATPRTGTWPETLEHDASLNADRCPRCAAEWWLQHRGARPG